MAVVVLVGGLEGSSYGGRHDSFGCIGLRPLVVLASSSGYLVVAVSYSFLGGRWTSGRVPLELILYGGSLLRAPLILLGIVGGPPEAAIPAVFRRWPFVGIPVGIYSYDLTEGFGRRLLEVAPRFVLPRALVGYVRRVARVLEVSRSEIGS